MVNCMKSAEHIHAPKGMKPHGFSSSANLSTNLMFLAP